MKLNLPVAGIVTAITEREFTDSKKGLIKSTYIKVQTDTERGSADTEIIYKKADSSKAPELFEKIDINCQLSDYTDKTGNTKISIKEI